tara:strand:- start:10857 stop:12341 length:1485 start_codon:yes stop_codon:yes gene_type:complete
MFKGIKFYFLFFFIIIIIFLIITQVAKPKYYNLESITYIRKFIPEIIKKPIRSVLYDNVVVSNLEKHNLYLLHLLSTYQKDKELMRENTNLIKQNSNLISSSYGYKINKIKTEYNEYVFKNYNLPILNYFNLDSKPSAYLEQSDDQIFTATGNGEFFYINIKNLQKNKIDFIKIESNLKQIINNQDIFTLGPAGIRDILIDDNILYLSYIEKKFNDCLNTSVLKAEINNEYLNFKNFFTYDECYSYNDNSPNLNNVNVQRSGGRLVNMNNSKILLTLGDYGKLLLAQKKDSLFGKIITIDKITNKHNIISMGHRNPQGLYYDKEKNILIFTEHGPKGGDEININMDIKNGIKNYGWPVASYGLPYNEFNLNDEAEKKIANFAKFYKSHSDYGFVEPIKFFNPAIGISEIIKVNKKFNKKSTNDFFVASFGQNIDEGDLSVHHFRFNEDFSKILLHDIIPLKERIRDMIYIEKINKVILLLESSASLSIMSLNNG